ncbi:MAG: MFS transporter [Chloroflexota bacterium]|nr:MFS transporter [Chloroflexota bacterium]
MLPGFGGLWRNPEFRLLWLGETVSATGSAVSRLAIPLTASLQLGASPFQMGLLGASQSVPFLLLGLIAGVWVDRLRRRPIMLAADLGRVVLLATIPLAAFASVLRLEHLLLVSVGVGVLNVFFDVAYGSFLPSLVRREVLAEGNAKLALSAEIARVSGPGLAGLLVQLLTAPIAIIVDAASFLVSAVALVRIRPSEAPVVPSPQRRGVWAEMMEGLQLIVGHPILRPLIGSTGLGNIGDGLFSGGVFVLFTTRELGIEPVVLGAILSGVGVGGLVGAALSGPVTHRFGIGPVFVGVRLLWGVSYLATAFVGGPPPVAAALLGAALAIVGMVNPLAGAHFASLCQAVTPERLLGRLTATHRVAMWGGVTLGSLLGGALGETVGLRPVLAMAGLLPMLGFVWLLFSPVRELRSLPAPPPELVPAGR